MRPAPPHRPTTVRAKAAERRERRRARHQQVWTLRRKGWSEHAIARHLGIGRSTVFRHLRHETFPERKGRSDAGQSLLDPWKPTILDRWNAGCRHSWRLFRDLQRQGYRGSYPTLARYTHRLRQAQEEAAAQQPPPKRVLPPVMDPPERPLTQRTAAWLILRHPDHRTAAETERLGWLRAQDPALAEATDLASDFIDLVRRRQIERLDPWLARAQSCALPAFRGFAKGLCTDYDAVRAAVTLPWGTGPVEGQINRLKMIKRQMYSRANLDLLNRRFLLAA